MRVPTNYLLLFVVTWMESLLVSLTTADLEPESVILSIGAFVLVTGSLFMAAMCTKNRARLIISFVVGIIMAMITQTLLLVCYIILGREHWIVTAWAILGILVCGIYIVVDIWMLLENSVNGYDDYINGALNLYLDMIRIFLYILMLLGKKK